MNKFLVCWWRSEFYDYDFRLMVAWQFTILLLLTGNLTIIQSLQWLVTISKKARGLMLAALMMRSMVLATYEGARHGACDFCRCAVWLYYTRGLWCMNEEEALVL